MRIIEKATLTIYSLIILAIAVILSIIVFDWIAPETIGNIIINIINGETSSKILLIINAIFILLSIKCIFFRKPDRKSKTEEQGILLQNDNGKLIISKNTIENLVNTIINQFESIEEGITSNITLNAENRLVINLDLTVGENVIIKELSANIQEKIKTTLKTALDLEVEEVNIKIKDYTAKKENQQ